MPVTTPRPKNFTFDRISLPGSGILYIVDIKTITPVLRDYMDKVLGGLTFGRSIPLALVKTKIKSFLKDKKKSNLEIGAVAEYFVHLFLRDRGLKPQSLITNLEENSLKKGFDGLYILEKEEWLCESKSGSLTTTGVCHTSKVKEAYKGLQNKISGKDPNNPWQNAMYHAKVLNTNQSLIKKLTQLSDRFDNGKYADIMQFNIIPCGTIYLDGKNTPFKVKEIEANISEAIKKFSYKGLRIVCITKSSVKAFHEYLNS